MFTARAGREKWVFWRHPFFITHGGVKLMGIHLMSSTKCGKGLFITIKVGLVVRETFIDVRSIKRGVRPPGFFGSIK